VDGQPIGLIASRDEPHADAREALAKIAAVGAKPIMLTGDNRANGEAVAKALGIEARSEPLPEDKLHIVKTLAGQGGVAVVGDGINDAPALAAATVGIALGLKGIFLVTTVFGFTGLWIAVLAEPGATLVVTANALRFLGWCDR
jgi:Cd2+/Zn2+-exporting ATPase